jgi:cyanophycinase
MARLRDVLPLYMLADSQLLFWTGPNGPLLASLLKENGITSPRVAYIGASNGDSAEAHSIFAAAMDQLGSVTAHHVRASYSDEDREFLETADVILLAGGDVESGWNTFQRTGMRKQIENLYHDGTLLIGVSAGAVQCGSHTSVPSECGTRRLIETFSFAAYIVDVHDEKQDWQRLSSTIHLLEGGTIGLGIPSGGGLAMHPDGMLEPIRQGVHQFTYSEGRLRHAMLMPTASRRN